MLNKRGCWRQTVVINIFYRLHLSPTRMYPFSDIDPKSGPQWARLTVLIISMQSSSFFGRHLLYCQWILLIIVDIPKDQTWFGFMADFFSAESRECSASLLIFPNRLLFIILIGSIKMKVKNCKQYWIMMINLCLWLEDENMKWVNITIKQFLLQPEPWNQYKPWIHQYCWRHSTLLHNRQCHRHHSAGNLTFDSNSCRPMGLGIWNLDFDALELILFSFFSKLYFS